MSLCIKVTLLAWNTRTGWPSSSHCLLAEPWCQCPETQVSLEVLRDLYGQSLEGQLLDHQLSGLLISPDLPQVNDSWSLSVRLLYTACGRGALPCRLGSQLLPGCFLSGTLSWSLLRSGHSSSVECSWVVDVKADFGCWSLGKSIR